MREKKKHIFTHFEILLLKKKAQSFITERTLDQLPSRLSSFWEFPLAQNTAWYSDPRRPKAKQSMIFAVRGGL